MPENRPFRALQYDTARVALVDVVAPPYDVIDPDYQNRLYDRSPYNIIRLILGRDADRYAEASRHLEAWKNEGVLVRDKDPAMYVLEQEFQAADGHRLKRRGIIAACRVDDFSAGTILPHERTLSKPKEDRFRLLQATNTNFSQIFSLYADPDGTVESILRNAVSSPPIMQVVFEEVINRVWRIGDEGLILTLSATIRDRTALIADGHHRYETALAYRDLMRLKAKQHSGNEPYEFTMMFFAGMESEGLTVLPTHRVVQQLQGFQPDTFVERLKHAFEVRKAENVGNVLNSLNTGKGSAFGMLIGQSAYFLRLKDTSTLAALIDDSIPAEVRELDVTILHTYILEDLLGISKDAQERKLNLDYLKTAEEVERAVEAGRAQIGFLLNPTRLEQVRRVTRAGYTMPQKSTFFHPKLVSGLLLNPLE